MTTRPDDEKAVVVHGPWKSAEAEKKAGPDGEPVTVAVPVPGTGGQEEQREGLPRRAARAAAASLYQTLHGHTALAWRCWDAATHAALREQIRLARASGDAAALGEWIERLNAMKGDRRQRLRELPETIAAAAIAGLVLLAGLAATLLVLGIAVTLTHPAGWGWSDWWEFWATVVDVLVTVAVFGLQAAAWGAAPAWLWLTWRAGRDDDAPAWTMPPHLRHSTDGDPITPSVVVTALRDLGIPTLRKSIQAMGDVGAAMLGPIVIAGCGVEVDVALPSGVSTEEVQNRRRKLAENLGRHEHELFITIPQAARTVRLWIADAGALDEPIGPSPLVVDPETTADYYTGRAPWGQDLRGDALLLKLLQCHLLTTGLSNQGKTAALRALALWLAFDPTVEFRLGDLKGVGDWRMFDGIATTLIQGPTDEHVMAVTEMVEECVAEMERRITKLERSGSTAGVTRDMARSGQGFHPIICIVDEAQVAFMCPAVGDDRRPYGGTKAISRYFMAARKLHNQGRAVNVVLWQGTQDPTDENLPKLVREGAHIRASLVLGTESQARMALGEKAVDGGAAPHKLRQGLDKGTLVVTGEGVPLPPGQPAITVRTHYVDGDDAVLVADRARARRARVATRTVTPDAGRDELADIAECMRGEKRVLTREMLLRLAELDPYYRDWTFQRLAETLAAHDVEARKSDGVMVVRADDIRRALTAGDDDDREEDE